MSIANFVLPPFDQDALVQEARDAAARNGLDAATVCGVCEEESGRRDNANGPETWNPWAMRFEPAFEARYIRPAIAEMPTTEEMAKAVSFGLMQIMGLTAREFGFKGHFLTQLCDPDVGLEYGCRKLKHCFDISFGNLYAALSSYNGGGDADYGRRVIARIAKYAP